MTAPAAANVEIRSGGANRGRRAADRAGARNRAVRLRGPSRWVRQEASGS